VPYALLDLECMTIQEKYYPLTEEQLKLLEIVTAGTVSVDENIVPDQFRKMAELAEQKGWLVQCEKGTRLQEYQKFRSTKARYTHTLLWSVTGACNLRCKHCYLYGGENRYGELSLEKCDEIIRQCVEANVNMVALTGGEPLVRRDFWTLVDHILAAHIKILQVFTNGMRIDEAFLTEFEKRNINPNYFLISFDGVGCHDWMRGVDGAEKAAVNAIKLFVSHGYRVIVSTALHSGNLASLDETYRLMKELGVDTWKLSPVIDTGNWTQQENNAIDYRSVFDVYLKLLEQYISDGMPLNLTLAGFFVGYKHGDKPYMFPSKRRCSLCNPDTESLCEAVRITPYLLPDGRVLPCIAMSGSSMEDIAPNILAEGQSLEKALSDSPIDRYCRYTYADLFKQNSECAACEHHASCSGCRANALANGGFFKKDPIACTFYAGGYEEKIHNLMKKAPKPVLQVLAERYWQLYLTPAKGKSTSAEYKRIVCEGGLPDGFTSAPDVYPKSFTQCGGNRLYTVQTPAGSVEAVQLQERVDFERFIQILVHKCEPVRIPATMGSCAIMGLTNWRKIQAHKEAFLSAGNPEFLWNAEFASFTADQANYKDSLIVLSSGDYSAVPAGALGLTAEAWQKASVRIRLYHECTHIVCRRRFPEQKHAVWDELLADCIGLCAAFGDYNRSWALRFMGILEKDADDGERPRYIGGRLENYVAEGEQPQALISCILEWTSYLEDHVRSAKQQGDITQDDALFALCLACESGFWKEVYHDK